MPLLVSFNLSGWTDWRATDGTEFKDDDVTWQGANSLLVSNEDFADTHFWDNYLMGVTPLRYQMAGPHGGYCKMSFGSINLNPDMFEDNWPPPVASGVTFEYTASDEASKETLFEGGAHLSRISRESVTYNLYAQKYDVDLLKTVNDIAATDYDGNTDTVLPRAFGSVTHQTPVRLADVGGKPTYHNGYITGTKGTDWNVFDDGVNIDANVTDNGDYTFRLSATPVGEVTITGTGEYEDLISAMAWACSVWNLALSYNIGDMTAAVQYKAGDITWQDDDTAWADLLANSDYPLAHWAGSQRIMIDFFSDLCAWLTCLFYIRSSTLYLLDMANTNTSRTMDEYDFMPSDYSYDQPVATLAANWETRAAVEETIGKYVKTTEHRHTKKSDYTYGEERAIEPYHDTRATIDARLAAILAYIHKPSANVRIPFAGNIPLPGEAISFTDTSLGQDISVAIKSRTVQYNFNNEEVTIEGEGSIS